MGQSLEQIFCGGKLRIDYPYKYNPRFGTYGIEAGGLTNSY